MYLTWRYRDKIQYPQKTKDIKGKTKAAGIKCLAAFFIKFNGSCVAMAGHSLV